jgi:hypothetical protein
MREAQQQGLFDFSGVVAVHFLAGYSGFPEQSRMFSALPRDESRIVQVETTNQRQHHE